MSRINTAVLGAIAALTLAACSAGGLPNPEPAGTAATTVPALGTPAGPTPAATWEATPEVTPEPGVTPRPSEVPGPPVASLLGGGAGPVAGELGTFFWGGLGSDSPWVVPTTDLHVEAGGTLAVTLKPGIAQERWTAAWAPVRDGGAGAVGAVGAVAEGSRGPLELTAPGQPGPWGLLVELHFQGGQRAAWYWSVVVGP